MKHGTFELIIVSFPEVEPHHRHFGREVRALERLGHVRLVDQLFLLKLSDHEIVFLQDELERSDGPFGGDTPLHRLLGLDDGCLTLTSPPLVEPTCTPGVRSEEVRERVAQMEVGEGLGLALFEQLWSERLVERLTSLGGVIVDLSPLPADDLELVGRAISEAANATIVTSAALQALLLSGLVDARDLELECAALVDSAA